MKLTISIGAFLFVVGASPVIYNWVSPHYDDLPAGVVFAGILLMVIPVITLIGWVVYKSISKL